MFQLGGFKPACKSVYVQQKLCLELTVGTQKQGKLQNYRAMSAPLLPCFRAISMTLRRVQFVPIRLEATSRIDRCKWRNPPACSWHKPRLNWCFPSCAPIPSSGLSSDGTTTLGAMTLIEPGMVSLRKVLLHQIPWLHCGAPLWCALVVTIPGSQTCTDQRV